MIMLLICFLFNNIFTIGKNKKSQKHVKNGKKLTYLRNMNDYALFKQQTSENSSLYSSPCYGNNMLHDTRNEKDINLLTEQNTNYKHLDTFTTSPLNKKHEHVGFYNKTDEKEIQCNNLSTDHDQNIKKESLDTIDNVYKNFEIPKFDYLFKLPEGRIINESEDIQEFSFLSNQVRMEKRIHMELPKNIASSVDKKKVNRTEKNSISLLTNTKKNNRAVDNILESHSNVNNNLDSYNNSYKNGLQKNNVQYFAGSIIDEYQDNEKHPDHQNMNKPHSLNSTDSLNKVLKLHSQHINQNDMLSAGSSQIINPVNNYYKENFLCSVLKNTDNSNFANHTLYDANINNLEKEKFNFVCGDENDNNNSSNEEYIDNNDILDTLKTFLVNTGTIYDPCSESNTNGSIFRHFNDEKTENPICTNIFMNNVFDNKLLEIVGLNNNYSAKEKIFHNKNKLRNFLTTNSHTENDLYHGINKLITNVLIKLEQEICSQMNNYDIENNLEIKFGEFLESIKNLMLFAEEKGSSNIFYVFVLYYVTEIKDCYKIYKENLKQFLKRLANDSFFIFLLPEFSQYDKVSYTNTYFNNFENINLNSFQQCIFCIWYKLIEKILLNNKSFLDIKNPNYLESVRHYIRKFTFIVLEPFFNDYFASFYNNLLKNIYLKDRATKGFKIDINCENDSLYVQKINFYVKYAFLFRFIFIFTDLDKYWLNGKQIFKKFFKDQNYEVPFNKTKLVNIFNWDCEFSHSFYDIKKKEEYWIPYLILLSVYFDKISFVDFSHYIQDKKQILQLNILTFILEYYNSKKNPVIRNEINFEINNSFSLNNIQTIDLQEEYKNRFSLLIKHSIKLFEEIEGIENDLILN